MVPGCESMPLPGHYTTRLRTLPICSRDASFLTNYVAMVPSLLETSAETLAQNINNYEALEKLPEELVLYIFEVRALHSNGGS